MIKAAETRAEEVILTNKYFSLATVDDNGPWAAALAYTIGFPNYLYFFSHKTSLHGQAMLQPSKISGVIFDSTVLPENAESIQFSGVGEVCHKRELIEYVLEQNYEEPPNEDKINELFNNHKTVLFRVSIDEAFVLDQKLFLETGIDGRQPFDIQTVFSRLANQQ
ncbi:MAG: pyridoxamine 5'-phosphate oxidase family protein [Alphaproteobacteria bacterium]|nr:pyridoxamine 5'-phosphate oxidase family protein [Alphaproteobacteria bacterium]MDD9919476.1 pyridoxamine 5'-phosphate oxidase family protein [Alphaproteobacteria bacterium]